MRVKKIFTLGCAAILSLTVLCAGCEEADEPVKSPYFFAMAADAAYILPAKLTSERQSDCYKLYGETRALLDGLDSSLSATNENSYVAAFNNAKAGEKVELNAEAYEVFSLALDLYGKTDGYYNPAVYYSVAAYGFNGSTVSVPQNADELPTDEVIAKYNLLAGCFGDTVLSEEDGKYFAKKPDTEVEIDGVSYAVKIDLGGIGKGYAADKVNALMDKYNITYGYFTFGASSIAFRKYIDVSGESDHNFTLALGNPRKNSQFAVIPVKDKCISTSGDYVNYYEIDQVRYCHVIDPTTGKPVKTGIMSATVIGGSAAENDAYSTAIMAMGKDRAQNFIKTRLAGRQVVFTYDSGDGYEIYTNVRADVLKILDSSFTLKEIL